MFDSRPISEVILCERQFPSNLVRHDRAVSSNPQTVDLSVLSQFSLPAFHPVGHVGKMKDVSISYNVYVVCD